ncbi:MAG: tetratricopeptide repeat protein, partial [Terracidiphilus sp.]
MYTFQSINVDSLLRKIESATENAMRLACKTGQGCKVGWWAVIGLLWLFASTIVYGACTAPPALLARVKNQPTAENYSQLGSWFGGRKQFACAADAYSSAVKIEPDSASLNFMLGLSLFSAGQDNKAIAPLLKSARLNSNDVRPHLTLGAALDRLKEIEAAESEWRAALAIDPDSESALDGLSQDLLAAKDYNSVIALLGKPSGVRVRSPLQSLNLGSAYAAEARLDEAAAVLREGLNTAPDSLQIADQLGLVLMLMARVEEAYAVFDLALEKHPRDQHTQLLYLRVLVTSHSDKAPQLAHKVLEAYPDNWDALYLNAVLEDRDGDDQQARTHLNRSVARNPNDSQSQEELGSVLAKLGDLPGAKEHLEKAIALGD